MGESPIFVAQFVEHGLGNAAHLVGSRAKRVAAMIDPVRDVDPYVQQANRMGVTIEYALDTHLHNDFVSGARELAARTGATIGASRAAAVALDHRPLSDGDRLPLGDVSIRILATPGHTPEHLSFAVADEAGRPLALFSGGALMVGGAARTDLLGKEMARPLASDLYRSLHEKILRLPDAVDVFPTHGAGSFCAAPATQERRTTIGRERRSNPLAIMTSEEDFVAGALEGLPSYPTYFGKLRPVNQSGPRIMDGLPTLEALSPSRVQALAAEGVSILDVRPPPMFLRGHIPGAYGIWSEAPLTTWAGWLIPFGSPLVIVSYGPRDLASAVRQLVLIGFDDLRGSLDGGMVAWERAGLQVESVPLVAPWDLVADLKSSNPPVVLDVRQDDEWAEGHIPAALHIENGRLPWDELLLPKDRRIVVHCHTGNRSTSGISVLLRRGYRDVAFLDGGWAGWAGSGFPVESS